MNDLQNDQTNRSEVMHGSEVMHQLLDRYQELDERARRDDIGAALDRRDQQIAADQQARRQASCASNV